MLQDTIASDLNERSGDTTRNMSKAVLFVGTYVQTEVHDTGHGLFLEPGTALTCTLICRGTMFPQYVKLAPALNHGRAGV